MGTLGGGAGVGSTSNQEQEGPPQTDEANEEVKILKINLCQDEQQMYELRNCG